MRKTEKEDFVRETLVREEENFRKKKACFYPEVPEVLDTAVLACSRENLEKKRFAFVLPVKFRRIAALLILAFVVTGAYMLERSFSDKTTGKGEYPVSVWKKNLSAGNFTSFDVADAELFELNSELDLVQNLLAYSPAEKQKIN